jgi:hypothetical protein
VTWNGPPIVYPSPRKLVEQLLPDERVAVDLILEKGLDTPGHMRPQNADLPNIDAEVFTELVPDKKRRSYLLGLASQLRALGITLHDWDAATSTEEP